MKQKYANNEKLNNSNLYYNRSSGNILQHIILIIYMQENMTPVYYYQYCFRLIIKIVKVILRISIN